MKDKIKEILTNRLGQVVNDDVLDKLSAEISQMLCHNQLVNSDKKNNITIDDLINNTARVGDIFRYDGDYYEIVEDVLDCGFDRVNCECCPLHKYGCMNMKGFRKI